MKREPRFVTMKEVTQKDTRSWRRERTISMRCISLQAFSHSPGKSEESPNRSLSKGVPAWECRILGCGIKEQREGRRKAGEGTWEHSLFWGGMRVPQVPVTRILFKGVHEAVEVGQFV